MAILTFLPKVKTHRRRYNPEQRRMEALFSDANVTGKLEAPEGIEPPFKDLQSSA